MFITTYFDVKVNEKKILHFNYISKIWKVPIFPFSKQYIYITNMPLTVFHICSH